MYYTTDHKLRLRHSRRVTLQHAMLHPIAHPPKKKTFKGQKSGGTLGTKASHLPAPSPTTTNRAGVGPALARLAMRLDHVGGQGPSPVHPMQGRKAMLMGKVEEPPDVGGFRAATTPVLPFNPCHPPIHPHV